MQVFFRLVYLLPHINCLLQKLLGWFKHWIILWLSSKTVMYHLRLVIMCCICFCTIFGTNNCLYTIYFFSVATRIDEIWRDFWGLRHDFLGKKACFFSRFWGKIGMISWIFSKNSEWDLWNCYQKPSIWFVILFLFVTLFRHPVTLI